MSNSLIPAPDELKAIEVMAKNAVDSKYFEKLGGYAGVFSICMYAREMGLPVMSSLFGGLQNVMGKITIAPQMMNAMIRKAGHTLKIDSSDAKCTITGTRRDTGESVTVSFSVEDARRAGIFKAGGGWDKYPSDMCFARALSRLARRLFPDVIGMAYVEGEIEDKKSSHSKLEEAEVEEPRSEEEIMKDFRLTFAPSPELDKPLNDYAEMIMGIQKCSKLDVALKALADIPKFESYFEKWREKQASKAIVSSMDELVEANVDAT